MIHEIPNFSGRGACADNPELFFPVGNAAKPGSPAQLQQAQAKAVCRRCPVAGKCLAWAVNRNEEHGVWGGTTPEERRTMRAHRTAVTA